MDRIEEVKQVLKDLNVKYEIDLLDDDAYEVVVFKETKELVFYGNENMTGISYRIYNEDEDNFVLIELKDDQELKYLVVELLNL
jgi:hypothetical protein